jgi:putative SOS response-associated peptidase YedK
MCGRFTLTIDPAQLQDSYSGLVVSNDIRPYLQPRYNIAPSNLVAVVANTGENRLDLFRWGLIPSWASLSKPETANPTDSQMGPGAAGIPDIGNRLINARSDTLEQKPSFRTAYRKQRCLILADGFYEWWFDEKQNRKIPYFFYLKETDPSTGRKYRPFAFAGLWDRWTRREDGTEILTCAIITTSPNDAVAPVHSRMPVILTPENYAVWLSPGDRRMKGAEDPLLTPYPASEMASYPVSRRVNSPDNDDPQNVMETSIE